VKILVANLGSTSFKYRLFDMATERVLARGGIERIGAASSRCFVEAGPISEDKQLAAPDHAAARFPPDLALSHRFTSRQQRNWQSLSAVRAVPARSDYADFIAAVTATKARSPMLVGIIWKSA
jgi:acetate kinase